MATQTVNPWSDVPTAMDFASRAVTGYGKQLQPQFLGDIGTALGRLNSIGALRSGGVPVALKDITTAYANQIGAFADQAAGGALNAGLQAGGMRFGQTNLLQEQARARKASLLRAIGGVLGAGVGFFATGGNPAGAVAGAKVGSSVGGTNNAPDYNPTYYGSYG